MAQVIWHAKLLVPSSRPVWSYSTLPCLMMNFLPIAIALLIVLLVVSTLFLYALDMPHSHSGGSRQQRTSRAVERGFVKPKDAGYRHILVREDVADRVKIMSKSLTLHCAHNERLDVPPHYARAATHQAEQAGHISVTAAEKAQAVHQSSNKAKHNWKKNNDDWNMHDGKHEEDAASTIDGCMRSMPVARSGCRGSSLHVPTIP